MEHIVINLEAPLLSFGGATIDHNGITRSFPSQSMLAGLLGNALGWRRVARERHQALQDNLVFAVRIDRETAGGVPLTDFQTVRLVKGQNWTTSGKTEGPAGGEGNFTSPHLRYREYHNDLKATLALRLKSGDNNDCPTLDHLAEALQTPARPLFIGRKPCLPATQLYAGVADGATALDALLGWPLDNARDDCPGLRTLWPSGEGSEGVHPSWEYTLTDQRDWISGLHGGGRRVCEARIDASRFAGVTAKEE